MGKEGAKSKEEDYGIEKGREGKGKEQGQGQLCIQHG
jgi:hypothetical protein